MKYLGKSGKTHPGKSAGRPSGRKKPQSRGGGHGKTREDKSAHRAEQPRGRDRGSRGDAVPQKTKPARQQPGARPRERAERGNTRSKVQGPRPNLFGLHAVKAAWENEARTVGALYITPDHAELFPPRAGRPSPVYVTKEELDNTLGRDVVHQGAAMAASPVEDVFVQDLINAGSIAQARSVILVLDQVTDPHNVGAILRSACAFGATGVVMQRRHAPELEGILAKTASGAAEYIPTAYETNLSRALEELADAGYTVIGLDEHSTTNLSDVAPPQKAVLVLGAEGPGMRRLIREHCSVLVTLPTRAPIASLNVSNAAAVALYALIHGKA